MTPSPPTVFFTEAAESGLSEPVFIIKMTKDSKDFYYLTKVVWEFPPPETLDTEEPDRSQKVASINAVVGHFNSAAGNLDAKEITDSVSAITNGQAGGGR